jgi:ABC-type dipeptide/oligopeptide/nickel transport system permease component
MVISVFALAITLLTFFGSVRAYGDPESNLSGYEYKKYLSFEYYKQQEQEYNTDKKNMNYLASLSDSDWKSRWNLHRETSIAEVIHKEKSSFFEEFIYFIVFSILLGLHFYLYRRFVIRDAHEANL